MIVNDVHFRVPEDSCEKIGERIKDALDRAEATPHSALRMVFTVTPSRQLFRRRTITELRETVEPFRCRVRYACVENVIVLPNLAVRRIVKTIIPFFKPDVPTKIVDKYTVK